ncbi:glycosyltransferase family 4 protein [Peribacillus acanthi]|uniref:glycosyltransferase family 4 protein n=1 Tax=Peribacillus acanthi TaxID=2171554 RepID=UPI000D3E6AB8|nr:glycosyltransferase family 4 protein [Peribacillus acanthi]
MKAVYYAHMPINRNNDIETIRSLYGSFYCLFKRLETGSLNNVGLCLSGLLVKNLADANFLSLYDETVHMHFPKEHKKYGTDLLSKVRMFLQMGTLKLVGTTVVPFPLTVMQTSDMINWQIKEAVSLYEQTLHCKPNYFLPPLGAFVSGIDEYILRNGYENILLDSHTMKYKEPHSELTVSTSPYGLMCFAATTNGNEEFNEGIIHIIPLNEITSTMDIHSNLPDENNSFEQNSVSHLDFSYFGIGNRIRSLFEEKDVEWILELIEMESQFIGIKNRNQLDTKATSEFHYLWSMVADSEMSEAERISYKNKFNLDLQATIGNNYNWKTDKQGQDHSLNILMLTWEFPPHIVGGLSRHVFGLSRALVDLGHNVHIVTVGLQGQCSDSVASGVHVHRIEMEHWNESTFIEWVGYLNIKMGEKISNLFDLGIKPDIIHAHDWLVGASAMAASQRWDIPLFATIHATENGRHNGIHNSVQFFIHEQERRLIEQSDQLIVCSEYMKNELMEIFSTPSDKMAVIANGVEKNDILGSHKHNQIEEKVYSIFSWGRLVPEKGFDILIEATEILKSSNVDINVVIAGRGPMLETYRGMIQSRGLEKQIQLIGFIQDEMRNQLLNQCDLTVFPSTYEPFGIVALEAMISGKPVIVSETGGLKAIIKNCESGLLFKTGDALDLAQKIEYMMSHREVTSRMALKGQEVATKLFSWERVALQTAHLIKEFNLSKRIERGERNELSSTGSR